MWNLNRIPEFLLITVALVCIAPGRSDAQDSARLEQESETNQRVDADDRFLARVGMFSPDRRLKLGADGSVTGEHVDIERSL